MTRALSLILFFTPLTLAGQVADSLIIKKVDSLIHASRVLTEQRNFGKALEINSIAEHLALENLGKESAAYGSCCFNHGRASYFKGDYPEAEKWLLESKAIREKVLGKEHPDYAWSLNNLGILAMELGNYEKAEQFYLESKSIREKVLGKEHIDYASSLHNLAYLYRNMGEFEKSESLNLKAKAIREKILGKKHPDYARSLNNLAILYADWGDYDKAEPFFLEAKEIKERTLGKESAEYINSLNNLAVFYRNAGKYDKAEPLFLEALNTQEKSLNKKSPTFATGLNNLAALYFYLGDYTKAESYFLKAKDIREEVLGKEHNDYAMTLNNLAALYDKLGNYEKAEPLFLEAKVIWEKVLGKEHPRYIENLSGLADLCWKTGRPDATASYVAECAQLNQAVIARAIRHLSERELNNYLKTFLNSEAQVLSYAQLSNRSDFARISFDNSLFYKGFVLNATTQLKHIEHADPETADKVSLLKSYRRRLAVEYAKLVADRDNNKVSALEELASNVEKELAHSVIGFGNAVRQVKWQEVREALKPREAAIEFVQYSPNNLGPNYGNMYAALVVRQESEYPVFIALFEEKSLDSLLPAQGVSLVNCANSLYSVATRGNKRVNKSKKSLYELIWKPLEKELTGVETIYFSPSGLIHRLNISALTNDGAETIADRYHLVEVGSTRQLVLPSDVKSTGDDAVLFGGIQYNLDSIALDGWGTNDGSVLASRNTGLEFTQVDSTLEGVTWQYLPWTEIEVIGVEAILKENSIAARLKTGSEATEESFKSIGMGKSPSPRILHVATHGFFFPDPKMQIKTMLTGGVPVGRDAVSFKVAEHPMMRSGLVLAGGNYAWHNGRPAGSGMEDGILTAYEISQMDLSNTELVVLSACETGLGDINGNEGVYGLQRAFKIAGAKHLIMSLWQVPDYQTQQLMSKFYSLWLDKHMTIHAAFYAAQKTLRQKFKDPFFWAGFILVE